MASFGGFSTASQSSLPSSEAEVLSFLLWGSAAGSLVAAETSGADGFDGMIDASAASSFLEGRSSGVGGKILLDR